MAGVVEPGHRPWDHWVDRGLAWRDRLLASPRFQRWAAGFVPTRPIARRHARQLFDLMAGFVYSQVLSACVELELFDLLAHGPRGAEELAARLHLPPDSARRLLDAAVSLRLLAHRGRGRYGLGELGAPLVGNAALVEMVKHHAALYADLADPVAMLRAEPAERGRTALARYWAYDAAGAGAPDPRVARYCALMAASQSLVAEEILDAYPMHHHRCMLDVGGGDGRFVQSVAERVPGLRLMLFDLPAVAAAAGERFERAGLGDRAQAFGGSFFEQALPSDADLACLVRVLHDHDDAAALAILRAVRAALPPGGQVLIAEPMARTPGAEAMGDAYFGFYLLAMGQGRPRTATELRQMLATAGFSDVRSLPTRQPLQVRLLTARRMG